jgi:hypothetical protein
MVTVTARLDKYVCIVAVDSEERELFLQAQADKEAFLEFATFVDGDATDFEAGWPCIMNVLPEFWYANFEEEVA